MRPGKERVLFAVRFILLMIIIFLFSPLGLGHALETSKPIRLAILPCDNIEVTFKKFYPLLQYLMDRTNLDLRLVVPADFTAFETALKKGEIDFALQDPHVYLLFANLYNNNEILKTLSAEGTATHSAVVVVRRDSPLKELQDLRGKTVMFGSRSSITKWVAARLLFAEHGINIDQDLRAYSHGGCCEDIAFNVYLKSVDAGVVCAHFLAEHQGKHQELGVQADHLVAVSRTKPFPNRLLAPRKDVNPDIISKINTALLSLDVKNPEQARILYRGELGGFQRARTKDYDALRKLVPLAFEK